MIAERKMFFAVAVAFALAYAAGAQPRPSRTDGYVIAADSRATSGEWGEVVDTLRKKHDAKVLQYEGAPGLGKILPELKKLRPKYVCFVARPENAGRKLVVAASRAMRMIDDDPYGDAIWGIVTGYCAADALRTVKSPKAREIRSFATSMGGEKTLDDWDGGIASDERTAANFWTKRPGGKTMKIPTGGNVAKAYADAFNSIPVDCFVTSGHASERDWQIIYNKNAGKIVHTKTAGLCFVEPNGTRHDVKKASLKVYLGAGNCLIGHVDSPACMATAWMHTAGVEQFAGYTVPSWYGFMGWGVAGLYSQGRYSLPEARYLENERLLWARTRKHSPMDAKGLEYDRDVFAFYGDPAQRIVFPKDATPYTVAVSGASATVRFTKDCSFPPLKDVKGARPIAALLESDPPGDTVFDARGVKVPDAVVTERFIFIPAPGKHAAGETLEFRIGKNS